MHRFLRAGARWPARRRTSCTSPAAPRSPRSCAATPAEPNVSAECCPHHLVFDERRYAEPDAARFAMTPPLRTPADVDALWAALADGDLDVLASDHSHLRLADKAADDFSRLEYGIPGVGLRLASG